MIQIPFFKTISSNFTQNIDLENKNIEIHIYYNTRIESWILNLRYNTTEIKCIRLIYNFPLLFRNKALFPILKGDFIILKIVNDITTTDINYDTIDTVFGLFYISDDEFAIWSEKNGFYTTN